MIQSVLLMIVFCLAADAPATKAELLEKVRGIGELESLSFVAEVKEDLPALAKQPAVKRTVRVNVVMADGAKFRVEGFQGDKPLGTIVSDGALVTEYDPDRKLWTRYPMPVFDKDFYLKSLIVADRQVTRFATSWVDERRPYASDFERAVDSNETVFLTPRQVGARMCVGLRYTHNELAPSGLGFIREKAVYYFDEESYLPARETMSHYGNVLLLKSSSGSMETHYLDVQANSILSDDTFTFAPPADAKYVAPNDPEIAPGGPAGRKAK